MSSAVGVCGICDRRVDSLTGLAPGGILRSTGLLTRGGARKKHISSPLKKKCYQCIGRV